MSWVTNVMLCVDLRDSPGATEVDRWLQHDPSARPGTYVDYRGEALPGAKGRGALRELTGPDTAWGGPKYPECVVWTGTLNHADVDAVVAKVAAMPWAVPAAVQLLIMDQEQSYFRLRMIRDGHIRQYAPGPPDDDTAW